MHLTVTSHYTSMLYLFQNNNAVKGHSTQLQNILTANFIVHHSSCAVS